MSNSCPVSVVMAVCDGSAYLAQQLDSVRSQTVTPDELVIADDGSEDDSVSIAKKFAGCSPKLRVRIIGDGTRLGIRQNFNRALCASSGDIVFLCDQDDVWLPQKIERMLEVFAERPEAVLAIHDLEFCREDLSPIGQTKIERVQSGQDVQRDYVVGMATAIRGEFLRLCLPIPDLPGVTHDRWLHDCAEAVGGKVVVDEVLALYRRHSQNAEASRAVNADVVTNKWTFLWARFKEPSRVKMLGDVPPSPLGTWLAGQRQVLIDKGYLDAVRLDGLIAREQLKTIVIRERNRLLQLPRWKRVWSVARLMCSGGYAKFFSWRSALKDLIKT